MTTNTFKRASARGIGTSRTTVYTCPASTTTIVLGITIPNILASGSSVYATVERYDGVNYTNLVGKKTEVPSGAALAPEELMGKLVLQAGDAFCVTSDTAASLDVDISLMEMA